MSEEIGDMRCETILLLRCVTGAVFIAVAFSVACNGMDSAASYIRYLALVSQQRTNR